MAAKPAPQETPPVDFRQMADMYHVPISDGTIKDIAGENPTPEKAKAFEDYLKVSAQGLFPTLAPQIAAGIPTANLLDPYRQLGKQMLGENFTPDFVNDPKASVALTGGVHPETGRPAPMSLDQWKQHLMTEPGFGWGYTKQAHERVNMLLENLRQGLEAPHMKGQPQ